MELEIDVMHLCVCVHDNKYGHDDCGNYYVQYTMATVRLSFGPLCNGNSEVKVPSNM